MHRLPLLTAPLLLVALACGDAPKLNVQEKPAGEASAPRAGAPTEAAPAPAEPRPEATAAPGSQAQLLAGHAPAPATELPANHPPLDLPQGHPPLDTLGGPGGMGAMGGAMGRAIPVVPAGSGEGATALVWTPGKDWVSEPPANPMRRAQYRLPGPGGDGECVVFYLGPGQGGDARANAERWASQFQQPDGKDPLQAMKTRQETAAGNSVLVVETSGTYMAGGMMGSPSAPKPGFALLGAVVPGPDADWFFKCTGPEKTMASQRGAFDAMVRSVRQGG